MPERALVEQLDQAIDRMLAGEAPALSADPELEGLMEVAGVLRNLPDDRFKVRLGRLLQDEFEGRKTTMTVSVPIEMPAGELAAVHGIIPFISVADGEKVVEFMKQTFGAEETHRHPHGPDGFVASLRIGDSDVFVMGGKSLLGQPELHAALHVYVPDCDTVYRRALDAGGVTLGGPGGVGEPADRPYGERAGFVTDPVGNYWFIATRSSGHYVGEGLKRVTPSLLPLNSRPLIDFLERAFDAKVEGRHEMGGRLMHAFVRIGDVMLEMGEAGEEMKPFGFYLFTDNVDAVYARAMAAGAVSLVPPADQPFGDRLAIVQDPAGNRWFAAKRIEG